MTPRIVIIVLSIACLTAPLAHAQDAAPPSSATGSPAAPASEAPTAPQATAPERAPTQAQSPAQAPQTQPQPAQQTYVQPQPYGYAPQQPQYYAPQPQGYYGGAAPRSHRPQIVGYRTEQRSVRALWIPGLITFAAGYVLNIAITPLANALSSDRDPGIEEDAWAWSLLPVVGPMVQLGIGAPHPAIPIATGLLQLGGLSLFIAGLATSEDARVPIYEGDPDAPTHVSVGVAPTAGGAQLGLTVRHL